MYPNHIGIILDGNRRFAKKIMKHPWLGHKAGLYKAREMLEWTCSLNIKYITAYILSLENITSRPRTELAMILRYIGKETDEILKNKEHVVNRNKIKVRFIGRLGVLPEKLQKKMHLVEKATAKNDEFFLNIAVAYGGQQEIVDATKKIVDKCLKGVIKPSQLDEILLKNNLYTNGHPCPDMIFRTGGEKRLSNFLPFQSAYSELIFIDTQWPEITRNDLMKALREYERRLRRFGK